MPLDALTAAAAERIKSAIAPCPVGKNSFSEVEATDVLAVANSIAVPHSPTVAALVLGASGALGGRASVKVYQSADCLRHLLEQAGAV